VNDNKAIARENSRNIDRFIKAREIAQRAAKGKQRAVAVPRLLQEYRDFLIDDTGKFDTADKVGRQLIYLNQDLIADNAKKKVENEIIFANYPLPLRKVVVLGGMSNGKSTLINTVAGGLNFTENYAGELDQAAKKLEVKFDDLEVHL